MDTVVTSNVSQVEAARVLIAFILLIVVCLAAVFLAGMAVWAVQKKKSYYVKLSNGEAFTGHKTFADYQRDGFFNRYYTVDSSSTIEKGVSIRVPRSSIVYIVRTKS
jgi:membrane-bound ClpP family serine protease